jgi:hypothetical protein
MVLAWVMPMVVNSQQPRIQTTDGKVRNKNYAFTFKIIVIVFVVYLLK